ncbi:hypothetical protein XANCAGTX0491_005935 [Xanthoria calcicola]
MAGADRLNGLYPYFHELKDSALKDSALKDSALKDSALKDSALKDRPSLSTTVTHRFFNLRSRKVPTSDLFEATMPVISTAT